MEYIGYSERNQRPTERFVLVLYSIYSVCIGFISLEMDWENWAVFLIFASLAVAWSVHVGNYRDYRFRAMLTTLAMQLCMLTFAIHVEDLFSVLALFAAFVIFLGLYGIVEVLYLTTVSAALIFLYHGVILGTIDPQSPEEALQLMMQVCNVFLVEYVLCFWVKKRNESNEQLMKVINTLKDAEQSKDDFLANVSHEIRTPINTIYGMSEIILHEDDPEKIKEQVFDIRVAGRSLMAVVGDILDFSELQSGKVDLEEENYNITSTINDVINMTMAQKSDKKIELIVDCDAGIPCVMQGDEKKIRRVIMNLVDNAIKFTNEGYISISIGCRREEYGVNLSITVKDTGIGMSEEQQEKLFTSFNQADSKRNRQEGGVGLGLAISQALVHRMDGAITVKSRLGKGSEFRFVIPQKVLDEQPIIHIAQKDFLNVAIYANLEQFDMLTIRDEYINNIDHMIGQMNIKCHMCRNLPELKRRMENEYFTHIFISHSAYDEDQEYFNRIARQTKVVTIIDRNDEKRLTNPDILYIYKPFYILPVVAILNGSDEVESMDYLAHRYKFVAPDAHVLVVDDNVMNLQVIEGLLLNYQIKVTTATSGREALEKIESMDYDFVFMDHMMPEMDGIETLKHIRKKVGVYYRDVPVIALTANAIAGTREMFLAEGFTDFTEKPIEISVLERVLVRNISKEKLIPIGENSGASEQQTTAVQESAESQESSEEMDRSLTQEEQISNFAREFKAAEEGELVIGDFDVETGVLYCGGMEGYIKVLQRYLTTGPENRQMIDTLYREQNWKDYTIAVHGVKSSMRSVGANRLSNIAKELEAAGKKSDIDYIRQHHEDLLSEYERFLETLREHPVIHPQREEKEDAKDLPELSGEVFDEQQMAFEDAMYALDGDTMLGIVAELEKYQYCGKPLREELVSVRRKAEMSDYMSAVETLSKIRKRLEQDDKGGGQS